MGRGGAAAARGTNGRGRGGGAAGHAPVATPDKQPPTNVRAQPAPKPASKAQDEAEEALRDVPKPVPGHRTSKLSDFVIGLPYQAAIEHDEVKRAREVMKKNIPQKKDDDGNLLFTFVETEDLWTKVPIAQRKYPFAGRCNKCQRMVQGLSAAAFSQHTQSCAKSKCVKGSGKPKLGDQVMPAGPTRVHSLRFLAENAIFTGIPVTELESFLRNVHESDPAAALPPMPNGALGREINEILGELEVKMREIIDAAKHLAIAVDGGTFKRNGMHVIIAVLYAERQAMVLRPHVLPNGSPFDAMALATAIQGWSDRYKFSIEKVRWFIVGGTSANLCAWRAINAVQRFKCTEGTPANDDDDDDENDDIEVGPEMDDASQGWDFETTAAAVVRELNRWMYIRCPPHIMKNWVNDVHKEIEWSKTDAAKFIVAFSNAMYEAPAVRRRLRQRIEASVATQEQEASTRGAQFQRQCAALERAEEAEERSFVAKVVLKLIEEDQHLTDAASQEVKDAVGAVANDTATPQQFEQVKRAVAHLSTLNAPTRFHKFWTMNDTRCHSSTFLCCITTRNHFDDIVDHARYDIMSHKNKSKATILGLQDKKNAIIAQLDDYITVFEPVANFMQLVSDVRRDEPVLHRLHRAFVKCREQVHAVIDANAGVADARAEWRHKAALALFTCLVSKEPPLIGDPRPLWEAARFLDPAFAETVALLGTAGIETEALLRRFSHGAPLVTKKMWDDYLNCVLKYPPMDDDVVAWWDAHADKMDPTFADFARAVLWLPCAVTQCDSVFSTASTLFTDRHGNMAAETSAARLMLKCNASLIPHRKNRRGYQDEVPRSPTQNRHTVSDSDSSPAPRRQV